MTDVVAAVYSLLVLNQVAIELMNSTIYVLETMVEKYYDDYQDGLSELGFEKVLEEKRNFYPLDADHHMN